jgi:hypothetical protein
MTVPALSVVVAVRDAQENVPAIIERLACERHPQVEFLLGYTDRDPDVPRLVPAAANVRAFAAAPGSLIPHLWRDGIRAAAAERVAVTTAHCVPSDNWVAALLGADLREVAGVGGTIENDPASGAMGWAIHLQRYAAFSPPQGARRMEDIAADNAVYRRADILGNPDLLAEGFFEPQFHARFRAAGAGLALDPRIRVTHRNRYRAATFFGQRYEHGRQFGAARAQGLPAGRRLLLALASPVLPLVFLRKIVRNARRHEVLREHWVRALPWLGFFLLGWGLGEARGYLESLKR